MVGFGWVSLCGGDEGGASSSQGESMLLCSVLGRIFRRSRPRSRGLGSMCRSIPQSANTHDNTVGNGDARQVIRSMELDRVLCTTTARRWGIK